MLRASGETWGNYSVSRLDKYHEMVGLLSGQVRSFDENLGARLPTLPGNAI